LKVRGSKEEEEKKKKSFSEFGVLVFLLLFFHYFFSFTRSQGWNKRHNFFNIPLNSTDLDPRQKKIGSGAKAEKTNLSTWDANLQCKNLDISKKSTQ
jgi:hypothetical protein